MLGMREVASGIGILSQRRKSPWLWSRVAGDAMDLALLGRAAVQPGAGAARLAVAAFAVAGVTALDVKASRDCSEAEARDEYAEPDGTLRVEEVVVINRSPDECYRYWRDYRNLPQFMTHLESVEIEDERRSHWVTREAGVRLEWDSEILRDEPGRTIQWHTLPGADVPHAGLVTFERAPGGRGTLVRVEMEYSVPGGALVKTFAEVFGMVPRHQVKEDLRRFKQVLETGEIATTVGQPSGRRSALSRLVFRKGLPG
jgi:uncharacterized membrane protein